MAREIQMIETKRLRPHPQNPRRELGDLQELIASIRESGVLQNLVVVPDPDEAGCWRVVIGHRRRAAAIVAGVKEVPCVVSDMGPEEQLGAMMAENVQRSNLTLADTVMGVRSLLDLPGVDEKKAAELTGLSKAYIRDRAKIARAVKQADVVKMEKAQATLIDMLNLARLPEDAQLHVINQAGEGKQTMADLIRAEVEEMDRAAARQKVEKWAREKGVQIVETYGKIESRDGYGLSYELYIPLDAKTGEKLAKLWQGIMARKDEEGFAVWIVMRKDGTDAVAYRRYKATPAEEPSWKKDQRAREARREKLDKAGAEILYRWNKWVLADMWESPYTGNRFKDFQEYVLSTGGVRLGDPDIDKAGAAARRNMWVTTGQEGEPPEEDVKLWVKLWRAMPIYACTAALWLRLIDQYGGRFWDWQCQHVEDLGGHVTSKAVRLLGYQETDEERELRTGTSKLYELEAEE